MAVGIEAINAYVGRTYIDVKELFEYRSLDLSRFDNLLMEKKSVSLPCEDPVSNAVNAAKPLIDALTTEEKNSIELVITSSESGLDFGKSLSTYIHDYLGLSRNCRLFEVKQACYGGTAALQMASNLIMSGGCAPDAKALVIATDCARSTVKMTYAEPSQGVAAVAMLVSDKPDILELDFGANGLWGYEVMDTCRPLPETELGDPDTSLFSYMDCIENAFKHYCQKVGDVDFQKSFNFLSFHTPFAGLVKSAHRTLMRQNTTATAQEIERDFQERMKPSLTYCAQVGNVYSASVFLALVGLIDTTTITEPKRVGLFSYGSGCSSEFYSGVITTQSKEKLQTLTIAQKLNERMRLSMAEYEKILGLNAEIFFGIKDMVVDTQPYEELYNKTYKGKGLLHLKEIKGYHRIYDWS